MWIVRLALRRPYTFVVMAMLIAILGGVSIATMPVDIFPYIDIPVVSVVWQYNGLSPEEMESGSSRTSSAALTSNVVDIEHIESQSHQSVAVVRVYFHPEREGGYGAVADRDAVPGPGPPHAAGHVSAAGSEVRRGERADPAARVEQHRRSASRKSSTWGTTSSARRSPPCRAPRCPIRSAARTARSWWT